jgi:hypothetical protein
MTQFTVRLQGKGIRKVEKVEAESYEEAMDKASKKHPNLRVLSITMD